MWVIGVYKRKRWHFVTSEMTLTFDRKTAKVYDERKLAELVAVIWEGKAIPYG